MNIILKKYDKFVVAFMALLFFFVAFIFWFVQRTDVVLFKDFEPLNKKIGLNNFGTKEINTKELAVKTLDTNDFFTTDENVFQKENSSNLFSPGTFIICEKDAYLLPSECDVCPFCGTKQRTFKPERFDLDSDGGGMRDDIQLLLNQEPIVAKLAEFLERPVYFDITNPDDDREDADGDGFTNAEEMVGEKAIKPISTIAFNPQAHPALANLLRFKSCENRLIPIFLDSVTQIVPDDPTTWEAKITLRDDEYLKKNKINRKLLSYPTRWSTSFAKEIRVGIGQSIFYEFAKKYYTLGLRTIERDFKVVRFGGDSSRPQIVVVETIRGKEQKGKEFIIKTKDLTKLTDEYLVSMLYLVDRVVPEKGKKEIDLEKERCIDYSIVVNSSYKRFSEPLRLVLPKDAVKSSGEGQPTFRSLVGYNFLLKELYEENTPNFEEEEYVFVEINKEGYPIFKSEKNETSYTIDKKFNVKKDLVIPNNTLITEPSLSDEVDAGSKKGDEVTKEQKTTKEPSSKM